MILVIFAVVIFLVGLLYFRKFWQIWKFPNASNSMLIPFFGHPEIRRFRNTTNKEILKLIMEFGEKTPRILALGLFKIIFISKAQDLEIILKSPHCTDKHYTHNFVKSLIGNGLVTADYAVWKKNRKLLMPLLCSSRINMHLNVFVEHSLKLVNVLREKTISNEMFNIKRHINKCLIDMFIASMCGINLDTQTVGTEFDLQIEEYLALIFQRFSNPLYHLDYIYKFSNLYKKGNDVIKKLHDFYNDLIYKCKVMYDEMKKQPDSKNVSGKNYMFSLLEFKENGFLNDQEVRDEIYTLSLAAFETTSSAVCFTLLMMAMHPDIQEEVYQEIKHISQEYPNGINEKTLSKLLVIEKVIKETLRLFPSVASLIRTAKEDINIRDEYVIPKNSALVLCLIDTHRSSEYYKDPLKFDPNNFSSENVRNRQKYSYLPFGMGSRTCIGTHAAYKSIKILVSTIILHYKLETSLNRIEDIELMHYGSLHPIEGFPLKIFARN